MPHRATFWRMWHGLLPGLLLGIVLMWAAPVAVAQEKSWERIFDVIYETQWQQSGVLNPVYRWPVTTGKTLTFSINTAASTSNADRAREALKRVLQVVGMAAQELAAGDEKAQIQFEIRRFSPEELQQHACYAQPTATNGQITKARVVLNEQSTYWCVLHELMHAMGLFGHPQGDTVLSYFEGNRLSLKPVDEFMLKAWYSDAIRPGMSPLVAVRTLNKMWIEQTVPEADRALAKQFEQVWYDRLIAGLEAFANGKGEPPVILYRSGKLNDAGLKRGLMNVLGILGFSYFNGLSVAQDRPKGAAFMLLSAQQGNPNATRVLTGALSASLLPAESAAATCKWLSSAALEATGLTQAAQDQALATAACKGATDLKR